MKNVRVSVMSDNDQEINFHIEAQEASVNDLQEIMTTMSIILARRNKSNFYGDYQEEMNISDGIPEPESVDVTYDEPQSEKSSGSLVAIFRVVRAPGGPKGYPSRKCHLMVRDAVTGRYSSVCGIIRKATLSRLGHSLTSEDVDWDAASEDLQGLLREERCERCVSTVRKRQKVHSD